MHTNPKVLALLALGEDTTTEAERNHVQVCAHCSDGVAEMAQIAHVGRLSGGENTLAAPSPEVWERVRSELGFTSSSPSAEVIGLPRRSAGHMTGRRLLTAAVAAGVALVMGFGLGLGWQRLTTPQNTVITQAPLTALPQWAGSSGQAKVEVDKRGNRWLVVTMTTPRPVDGNRQVWLIDTEVKGMQAMGFMSGNESRLPVPRELKISTFPIVDISVEPPNDVDPTHSSKSIVRGQLPL